MHRHPFTKKDIEYDLNGNILKLSRKGESGVDQDDLTYQYNGNQLVSVKDDFDPEKGFIDGNPTGDDYVYDANGNMTSDLNKKVQSVTYNYLNLPSKVVKNTNEYHISL